MADVATKVVLPMFRARSKPFVLVFWSRDPDGSQHNTGDSLNTITPGINGPTSMAGIKNADNNLGSCARRWTSWGSPPTPTSSSPRTTAFRPSRRRARPAWRKDVVRRHAKGLPADGLSRDRPCESAEPAVFDPNDKNAAVGNNARQKFGNGVLGRDPAKPDVVVATNGGSDLIYLPKQDKKRADRAIKALLEHDYVSGLFVDDKLGRFPARCRCRSSISGARRSRRPLPSWSISVPGRRAATSRPTARCRSPTPCCGRARACTAASAAAIRSTSWRRSAPTSNPAMSIPSVSNADVGLTIVQLLGLR